MFAMLEYLAAFSWLAFPLFLAVWYLLASNGRYDSFSCAPVRVREASPPVRRYTLH